MMMIMTRMIMIMMMIMKFVRVLTTLHQAQVPRVSLIDSDRSEFDVLVMLFSRLPHIVILVKPREIRRIM